MKRALRLVYGRDNSTAAEATHLLKAKDSKRQAVTAKASYSQLCNQALQSLVLLACKETNGPFLETSVKFSSNRFVPISFICSLVSVLDDNSTRNLCQTSKSLNIAIHSCREASHFSHSHMPLYCIDTAKVSENIQHLEETKGTLLANEVSSPMSHNENTHSSFTNENHVSTSECDQIKNFWFFVAMGSIFLLFGFCLQYLHNLYISIFFTGFIIAIIIWYIYKRNHAAAAINISAPTTHDGYDSI